MAHINTSQPDPRKPVVYHIRIKGHLGQQWADWFGDDVTVTLQDNGETLLTCAMIDQAALHALLRKVRDLAMPLIAVVRAEPGPADAPDPDA